MLASDSVPGNAISPAPAGELSTSTGMEFDFLVSAFEKYGPTGVIVILAAALVWWFVRDARAMLREEREERKELTTATLAAFKEQTEVSAGVAQTLRDFAHKNDMEAEESRARHTEVIGEIRRTQDRIRPA